MIEIRLEIRNPEEAGKIIRQMNRMETLLGRALFQWTTSRPAREDTGDMPDADLLILEVSCPSDIRRARCIRRRDDRVEIVLLTARGISADKLVIPEIRPLFLWMCPLEESSLPDMFLRICRYMACREEKDHFSHRFLIRKKTVRKVFPYSSILYFETRNKRVILYRSGDEHEFYDSFSSMEARLPEEFVRCHRSFIVNLTYVTRVDFAHFQIILEGDIIIPVSRKYRRRTEQVFFGPCGQV